MRLIQSHGGHRENEIYMFTSPVAEGLGQIAENGIQSTK